MNSMKIGTYQMDTTFGLYLPEYTIPAPAVQTNFVKIIGRDGSVDLSNALGLHYDSRTWSLDFKCFDPTVNWHTLSSQVMNAIHGKRLNFEFDDDPNYFWTGRVSVQNYVSNHGTGTLKVTIVSDPFKYAKLSTIVTKTASTGTDYTGALVTFNTANAKINDLSVTMQPIQDLHGYSSPWPAGGGINKIEMPSNIDTTNGGVRFKSKDGGIEISQTSTEVYPQIIVLSYDTRFEVGQTLTISQTIIGTVPTGGRVYFILREHDGNTTTNRSLAMASSLTFTVEKPQQNLVLVAEGNGITYQNIVAKFQAEIGSTAHDWAPYSNICPISGRTGATVWDDPKYGGTIEWNQLVSNGDFASTTGWAATRGTISASDNVLSYTISEVSSGATQNRIFQSVSIPKGHKVFASFTAKTPHASKAIFRFNNTQNIINVSGVTANAWQTFNAIDEATVDVVDLIYAMEVTSGNGFIVGDVIQYKDIFLCDLTEMFGSGNEPTTVDEFKALFPKSYYDYNSGEISCVSKVNGDPYGEYESDWTTEAGTVYGGTLDVVTGVLTVDRAYFTDKWKNGAGATSLGSYTRRSFTHAAKSKYPNYVKTPICNVANYKAQFAEDSLHFYVNSSTSSNILVFLPNDTDGETDIQVCYELATPLTYQLTGQEVEALVGTNNVWSDGGNVTVAVVTPETLTNNGRAVVPTLTASADMVLKWGNYSASVQQGTSTIPQLILENGANLIYIIGTGSISFTWQEVSL